MMMFIDYKKLSLYERDKTKQGIFISCDKSKKWYVLFKLSTHQNIKEFDNIIDATKFIVNTKKAFNQSQVIEI